LDFGKKNQILQVKSDLAEKGQIFRDETNLRIWLRWLKKQRRSHT